MPRITNKVLVELIAENKKFRESLKQAQSSTSKLKESISGPKGVNSSFDTVGKAAGRLIPIMATVGTAIAGAFAARKVIEAANQQEDAINSVATALSRAGENVSDTLPEMQKFASELQKNSTIGDETALSMLALAQGFGASKDQAKDVVEAAAELSAATGKSLNEAVLQVSKTLGGYAGELGEVNPAIKNLTKEQLQAGEATRVLIDQYGGTARSKLDTFSGAVTQSGNAFGDLLEEIGFLITKNPVVLRLIKGSTEAFATLGTFVKDNADRIRDGFNAALLNIIDIVPGVLRGLGALAEGFNELGITGDSVGFAIKEVFIGLKVTLNSVLAGITTAVANFLDVIVNLGEKLDSVFGTNSAEKYKPLTDALFEIRDSLTAEVAEDLGFEVAIKEGVDNSKNFFKDLADSFESSIDDMKQAGASANIPLPGARRGSAGGGGGSGFGSSIESGEIFSEGQNQSKLPEADRLRALEQIKLGKQPAGDFGEFVNRRAASGEIPTVEVKSLNSKAINNFKDAFNASKLADLVGGAIQGFSKGDAGAVVSGIAGGVAGAAGTAVLGPAGGALGGIVGNLVNALSQGPDAVEKMVEQFAEGLPVVLENIANAIPVFVQAFEDNADEIAKAIAKHSPQIAIEIALALNDPKVQFEIAKGIRSGLQEGFDNFLVDFNKDLIVVNNNLNRITGKFEDAIGDGVKQWKKLTQNFLRSAIGSDLDALANNISRAFSTAFKPVEDFLNRVGGIIGGLLPSNSDKKGQGFIAEKFGVSIPGLATGGLVGGDGFGDVNVFRLKRGELVTPDTTTSDLQEFLNDYKQGNGNQETLLNAILTELRRPQAISTEVKLDTRTLAEIMVKLDRQGQRLTA